MVGKQLLVGALAFGLVVAAPSLGRAAPNGDIIDLVCGGSEYQVVAHGDSDWSPGHVIGSNSKFIPTGFGVFTGTVYDGDGNVVDSFTEGSPLTKGRSTSGRKTIVDCTFEFGAVSDGSDPDFPAGYSFVGSGDVSGFFTR